MMFNMNLVKLDANHGSALRKPSAASYAEIGCISA
jgi:hypothetical protein